MIKSTIKYDKHSTKAPPAPWWSIPSAAIPGITKSAVKGAQLSQTARFQCNIPWAALPPRKAEVSIKRQDFILTCEITKYKCGESECFDFPGKPGADRELWYPLVWKN